MIVEAALSFSALILTVLVGIAILVQGMGDIIATKYAAENSKCIVKTPNTNCAVETEQNMKHFFPYKSIRIKSQTIRGIVHTEIDGLLARTKIHAAYDLEPSEYKRVQ